MKLTSLVATATLMFASTGLGEERLLEQDSRAFSDSHELLWKSEPITLTFASGEKGSQVLVLQYAPVEKARPELRVKLSLETPVIGNAGSSSYSSLSIGGFRDVHLTEKEGVRTMKIIRSIDSVDRPNKNTPRILERSAVTFTYLLNGDSLTLKGFSTEEPTQWGGLRFTVPEASITFKVQ